MALTADQRAGINGATPTEAASFVHSPDGNLDPQTLLALRMLYINTGVLETILKLSSREGIVSFAGGLIAPESMLTEEENVYLLRRAITKYGNVVLGNYGATEGFGPFREACASYMRDLGADVQGADDILVHSSSQQSLYLVGQLLINDGDTVIVDRITYPGFTQAMNHHAPRYARVAFDSDGMIPESLKEVLIQLKKEHRVPKLIYLLPNFHNPLGVTLPLERRIEIAQLAQEYGVPIVEDDPYAELRHDEEQAILPNVQKIWPEGTLLLRSFSKSSRPTDRLAAAVVPQWTRKGLISLKQSMDLYTGFEVQGRMAVYIEEGHLARHAAEIRPIYRERCRAMTAAFREVMPYVEILTEVKGGMFLFVRMPRGTDTSDLLPIAAEHGVAFVPGRGCFPASPLGEDPSLTPEDMGSDYFRASFSSRRPDEIWEGVRRLEQAFAVYQRVRQHA